jgi:hypothetical protein
MEIKNGSWVIKVLLGFLFTILFAWITGITNHVIANEKDSRKRDECQQAEIIHITREQTKVNQQILVALAEQKSDLVWIKERIKRDCVMR